MRLRRNKAKWSTTLPGPIPIPQVITLKTLANVRKLLDHLPKERRQLSTWQHVEATLQAERVSHSVGNASVALLIVQLE